MTTMAIEVQACGLDLVGRPAVVGHEVTTVTGVHGGEVFTAREPGRGCDPAAVTVLPVAGEPVEMPDVVPEAVSGHWVGPVQQGPQVGEHITALVLVGSQVRELVMPTVRADARQIVRAGASLDRAAMEALLSEALAHRSTRREHAAWVERLVAEAHEEADERDWCSEFDDFMDRAGLPRRIRDYDLCVEVTATVRVTRSGASVDEAVENLTREEVWAAMTADNIEWDAEED